MQVTWPSDDIEWGGKRTGEGGRIGAGSSQWPTAVRRGSLAAR